ncbi:hypothetical protein [Nocardioides sp. YIM 152315]|uniref:hypothetical protein n=1 Tax=Nocardioides sp. YIM 152315 TaxID=3031760 RepID=UPI0023DC82F7|nr:hypothetical protein [Nocardioides sp. YIM 152315]MDF1604884.1 hypothetical protein [Nocardioides sp. YIM 152315]
MRQPVPNAGHALRLSSTAGPEPAAIETAQALWDHDAVLPELAGLAEAIEADIVARHSATGRPVERGTLVGRRRWPAELAKLAGRLPASGRLIVDALSRDHLDAVVRARGHSSASAVRRARRLRGLVSPAELAAAAETADLAIVDVVPYGALLGGPEPELSHLAALERTHRWRRTLSWLPEDPGLTGLVLFLERAVVARLPTVVTHRMMIVVEKRRDPESNQAWLRREGSGDEPALSGELRAELDRLLEPAHARYLGFALLDAAQRLVPTLGATEVLGPARSDEYLTWRRAHDIDDAVTSFVRDWPRGRPARFRRGVDTTHAVDYHLVADLLEQHFRLFDEER